MRLFPAPLLLLTLLSSAAQTTAPAPASQHAPAAPTGMSEYHNDVLRLSYSYPSNYLDATSMVAPAFEASVSQDPAAATAAKCISLPFSRMAPANAGMGILMLIRADSSCLKKKFTASSVAELAQGEAQGLSAAGAKTNFGKPVTFQVASRPAALLQGSFTLPTGQSMQAMVVCVLDQPDIACWQFLSNTAPALSNMSTFPVTFDGSPATPLVPAAVLTGH